MTLPGEYVDPSPPGTLVEALQRANVSPRFCLELTCGFTPRLWKANGTLWTYDITLGRGVTSDFMDEIEAVYHNGVLLTAAPSQVGMPAGSWAADYTTGLLYLRLAADLNPMTTGNTVEVMAVMRFSDGPCDAGGYRWRPWLKEVPSLTRRISPEFNGITQIGGGGISLQNETHYFDPRITRNWDAGRARLKMGVSGLPWAEYKTLATFVPSAPRRTESVFSLQLQDPKILLDALFPAQVYDIITYPNLDPEAAGQPLQLAYGRLLGVEPVCIDTTLARFKLASHAIKSLDGVKVEQDAGWTTVNFASFDLAAGEFTLNPVDWQPGQAVVVDFSGMKRVDGSLMNNPAEIAKDILVRLGQPVDLVGFETARVWYDLGYFDNDPTDRTVTLAPSVYLDEQAKAISTLEEMMRNCRAYLMANEFGEFTMLPFRNYQAAGLLTLTDNNDLGGIEVDGSGTTSNLVQAGGKVTQVNVKFAIRDTEGLFQIASYGNPENKYTRNQALEVPVNVDSMFTDPKDASYLAEALVNEWRVDPRIYTSTTKWLCFQVQAGQHVRIVSPRHGLDIVVEVLQAQLNLTARKVSLTLGNLRGFEESSGFWVDAGDVTPEGADLAWPANGQDFDPAEGQYRRHQTGHWHGDDDFALVPATASAASDKDHAVSRWQ